MIPPCTSYILGIRKPVDCQLHQTKAEVSRRVHFSCNKLFPEPESSVKVPIEFSFVCFTRSQAESIKKELSSFKIPSQSLPWRDCLAPLRNEMCDKWLDETCAIEVPICCFLFLFIATLPGYMMYVSLLFLFKLICMFLCMFCIAFKGLLKWQKWSQFRVWLLSLTKENTTKIRNFYPWIKNT